MKITTDLAHQTEVFNRFKDNAKAALFMEQGTGKTRIIIKLTENHFLLKRIDAVVVITTSTLVMNWSMVEIPLHHTLPYHQYVWKRTKRLLKSPLLFYFIANVDATTTEKFRSVWKDFVRFYPNYMLVVDESTLVKNPKAERTRAVMEMAGRAKVRCIASGTPIPKGPLDLYSQTEILGPGTLGFKSYYAFKNRYAITKLERNGVRAYEVVTGYQNINELSEKVGKIAAVIKKKDCLDLPDKIYETVHVDFTPEQMKAYNDLVQRAITYLENHEITAVNAVSLINRLLQICCGQLKVEDRYLSIPNHRLETLKDLVEQSGTQVIVWSSYVQNSLDAAAYLGPLAVRVPAGLSPTALYSKLQAFRTGDKKALIANPASLGHGLTLNEAPNIIYLSNRFNLEHRLQSEDRSHRYGQDKNVLYTDLITLGTVEERVIQILQEKKNLADLILTKAKLISFITGKLSGVEPQTSASLAAKTG